MEGASDGAKDGLWLGTCDGPSVGASEGDDVPVGAAEGAVVICVSKKMEDYVSKRAGSAGAWQPISQNKQALKKGGLPLPWPASARR
jgi:hypothetical protein